jgi:hypothetical protein
MLSSKLKDITLVEFLDYCKDGIYEKVKELYQAYPNKIAMLKYKDPDLKTCLHLVSIHLYKGFIIDHINKDKNI